MAKTIVETKKYRILQGFNYKGKDGKSDKSIRLGPGEDVPELDTEERERLLNVNIICEVNEAGANVLRVIKDTRDLIELNESELRHLLPNPQTIKYLKHNKLSRKSLLDLRHMINDAILKLGLKPNFYIEETERLINLQLHDLNVSNDEQER